MGGGAQDLEELANRSAAPDPEPGAASRLGDLVRKEDPLAQWRALYSLLVQAMPGLVGSEGYAFQFANPEIGAGWHEPSRRGQEEELADAKPASSGAFYGPGATRVSQNFELFLDAIRGGDRALRRARQNYEAALSAGELSSGILGDLAGDLRRWRLGEGNAFEVAITKDTKIDHRWEIVGGGEGAYSGFLVSARGEALDAEAVDETYRLTVRYAGMTAYPIVRDRAWWNGGLLRVYDSDATEFSPPYTRSTFFGPEKGLLNAVPASVVVAYGARLTLRVARTFYRTHRLDLEAKGQIGLGPFKLNGTVRYVRTEEEASEEAAVLEYESTRRVPVVFGVFSETFLMD